MGLKNLSERIFLVDGWGPRNPFAERIEKLVSTEYWTTLTEILKTYGSQLLLVGKVACFYEHNLVVK